MEQHNLGEGPGSRWVDETCFGNKKNTEVVACFAALFDCCTSQSVDFSDRSPHEIGLSMSAGLSLLWNLPIRATVYSHSTLRFKFLSEDYG